MKTLTAKRVRELLNYNPKTGILTWRERPVRQNCVLADKGWNTRFAGKPAGRPDKHGHIYIGIAHRKLYETQNFAAHRLAWAHYYGEWPSGGLDHANRNPADNRIENLRLATQTQNLANASLRKDNTSGHRGVYWNKQAKRWCAYITKNKKIRALGGFKTKAEAIEVRRQEAARIFGEFANNDDKG